MLNPSYGLSKALVVGTPNSVMVGDKEVTGVMITATVAGNVSMLLSGGSTVVGAVPVGTTIWNLEVIEINTSGTTATATYYQLA
jgi:hypothetical protein